MIMSLIWDVSITPNIKVQEINFFFSPNIASSDPKYSLGINVSYKKGNIISFKLQPILQREVSQKEKHQYSILTHIYGI